MSFMLASTSSVCVGPLGPGAVVGIAVNSLRCFMPIAPAGSPSIPYGPVVPTNPMLMWMMDPAGTAPGVAGPSAITTGAFNMLTA